MAERCAVPRFWQRPPLWMTLLGTLLVGLLPTDARAAALTQSGRDASVEPAYRFKASERCFMRRINRVRARHGLNRLNWDKHIGYVARRHARWLSRYGILAHDDALGRSVTHWRMLGQNTGRGHRCRQLFRAFLASPAHRANILGRWSFVGVGTRRRNGQLFVQQVFEAHSNPGNIYGFP